jgi:hypothetical protein
MPYVHGGVFLPPPKDLILLAKNHIVDYKGAKETNIEVPESELTSVSVTSGDISWKPPPTGIYKANWNVVVDSKNGKLGYGGIVRGFERKVHAASCLSMNISIELVVGEALITTLHMVEFFRNRSFTSLILYWREILELWYRPLILQVKIGTNMGTL